MFVQTESKAQGWRAVATLEGRGECLLFVGRSSTHVRAEYVEAYNELLEDDEGSDSMRPRLRDLVRRVHPEPPRRRRIEPRRRWAGKCLVRVDGRRWPAGRRPSRIASR